MGGDNWIEYANAWEGLFAYRAKVLLGDIDNDGDGDGEADGNHVLLLVLRYILYPELYPVENKERLDAIMHKWKTPRKTLDQIGAIRMCFGAGPPPVATVNALKDIGKVLQTPEYLRLVYDIEAE